MNIVRLVSAVMFAGILAIPTFPAHEAQAQDTSGDRGRSQVENRDAGQAQPQVEGELAMLYEMIVDPDRLGEFEQALSEHARWRVEQGDPWQWEVYEVAAGEKLGRYIARAPELSWEDFDSYDAGFGPRGADHFNSTVGPHLASISNMVTRMHPDAMNLPQDMGVMQAMDLLAVTAFELEPGDMERFQTAMMDLHQGGAPGQEPSYYTFHSTVTGTPSSQVHFVTFHEGWADLGPSDPMVAQRLTDEGQVDGARGLDAHRNLMMRFPASEHMIVRLRPDLSVMR